MEGGGGWRVGQRLERDGGNRREERIQNLEGLEFMHLYL